MKVNMKTTTLFFRDCTRKKFLHCKLFQMVSPASEFAQTWLSNVVVYSDF